jgi:hypothetical protein
MPTLSIPFGVPVVLVTNQVYALPTAKSNLFCSDTTPALEQSNDITFAAKAAITLVGGQSVVTGSFIRATTGTPTIVLRRD